MLRDWPYVQGWGDVCSLHLPINLLLYQKIYLRHALYIQVFFKKINMLSKLGILIFVLLRINAIYQTQQICKLKFQSGSISCGQIYLLETTPVFVDLIRSVILKMPEGDVTIKNEYHMLLRKLLFWPLTPTMDACRYTI